MIIATQQVLISILTTQINLCNYIRELVVSGGREKGRWFHGFSHAIIQPAFILYSPTQAKISPPKSKGLYLSAR